MTGLRVLSTMGLNGVLTALAPEFGTAAEVRLDVSFMPTVQLLARIRGGERGDVAILTAEGIDALIAEGVLDAPRTDLARSFVGVAVRAGAPHPDISSSAAFVATLRAAHSVAMSEVGASGIFMAGLLERLGIAAEVRAKATILASGYTAALAAAGEVELAIQQVSELMVVPGVEIVGRLPAELGGETMFSAAPFRGRQGGGLIAALADPARTGIYRACGLEDAGTALSMQA